MPKYRFEFPAEPGVEPVYVDLPDDEAANTEALKSMGESILDHALQRLDPTTLSTKIYDEAGYHLSTVSFADAMGTVGESDPTEAGVKVQVATPELVQSHQDSEHPQAEHKPADDSVGEEPGVFRAG